VKITVTPDSGPVESLADLGALVERAMHLVEAGGPGDNAQTRLRVRTTPTGKLRALEVSW
jgi:hypothetical protein